MKKQTYFCKYRLLIFLIGLVQMALASPVICAASSGQGPALDKPRLSSLEDLPLEEILSEHSTSNFLAVLITGDGGWADLVRGIGFGLAQKGVPVVGLNSLNYFWTQRSPDEAARDLSRIMTRYLGLWHKEKVLLIGYSFGADTLPFMINRLPDDVRSSVAGVALISPTHQADFEIHILSHLGWQSRDQDYPVLPEVIKLKGSPVMCMAGTEEENCLCRDHSLSWMKTILFPGGHHLGKDYQGIVNAIFSHLLLKGGRP